VSFILFKDAVIKCQTGKNAFLYLHLTS